MRKYVEYFDLAVPVQKLVGAQVYRVSMLCYEEAIFAPFTHKSR